MKTDSMDAHDDDERMFVEALQQLAAETEPSPHFCARVLDAARQSRPLPQREPAHSPVSLHTPPRRSWAHVLITTRAGVLAAVLVLSLALNVWFASQAREATRTRQALVAAQAQLQESQAVSHQWQAQHAEAMRTLVAVQEQLQRTTSARVLPPPHGEQQASQTRIPETFTDLRGRLYTTAELAQALFPDPTVLGASRSLAPRTSSASAPAAVILPLTFAPHTATILPQYYEDLTRLGSILTLPPYADQRLRIDGHADSLEGEASGQTLAQERAENVKRYLVEHFAIVLERLLVQGYGASQPRVTNTSPEGREQNRRVEVVPLGQASSAH